METAPTDCQRAKVGSLIPTDILGREARLTSGQEDLLGNALGRGLSRQLFFETVSIRLSNDGC
jgi:hypothetical protein